MSLVHDARTRISVGRQLSRSRKKLVLHIHVCIAANEYFKVSTLALLEVVLCTLQRLCYENSLSIKVGRM